MRREPPLTRLARKVSFSANGCLEWTGASLPKGYGVIGAYRHVVSTHRLSWMLFSGEPVPAGLQVCHRCDNPKCVSPAHLFLGTARDNSHDCWSKGRGHGRLSSADLSKIKELHKSGSTQYEIAELMGVGQPQISRALNGKLARWRKLK